MADSKTYSMFLEEFPIVRAQLITELTAAGTFLHKGLLEHFLKLVELLRSERREIQKKY